MYTIELTADGFHTLFVPQINEHYHSVKGAVQESMHVYIRAGFNQCRKKTIHVLEIGFGTGLNALLTVLEAKQQNVKVIYTALEKYPLPNKTIEKLNYSQIDRNLFRQIHQAEWNKPSFITSFYVLHKIHCDFIEYDYPFSLYDVVYYDAFAPDKQSEAWSKELFDKLYISMKQEGILTTYCAKGNIRRMMQQSGFKVERIPGPLGKREMLRARI